MTFLGVLDARPALSSQCQPSVVHHGLTSLFLPPWLGLGQLMGLLFVFFFIYFTAPFLPSPDPKFFHTWPSLANILTCIIRVLLFAVL